MKNMNNKPERRPWREADQEERIHIRREVREMMGGEIEDNECDIGEEIIVLAKLRERIERINNSL